MKPCIVSIYNHFRVTVMLFFFGAPIEFGLQLKAGSTFQRFTQLKLHPEHVQKLKVAAEK